MSIYQKYENGMTPKYRAGVLGAPLSTQSANQIQDMGLRLNEGMKNIEISAISPEIAEGIPKEHFKEMRRLAELTDSKVSLHAPIIDASGFTQQGWSEQNRIAAEKQFNSIVDRAYDLDSKGNVPVVIHGANMMGTDWDKSLEEDYKKEYGAKAPQFAPRTMAAVNQVTGQIQGIEFKRKYTLGEEGEEAYFPKEQIKSINRTQWDQEKLQILSEMKQAMELEDRKAMLQQEMKPYLQLEEKGILRRDEQARLHQLREKEHTIGMHVNTINHDVLSHVNNAYDTYTRFVNKDKMEKEDKEKFEKKQKEIKEGMSQSIEQLDKYGQKTLQEIKKIRNLTDQDVEQVQSDIISKRAQLYTNVLSAMQETPEIFKPVSELSMEKASTTFANVAFEAFKKHGEKSPIIAIENSYPNMPLATAGELKEAIEKSRDKLAEKLVKEKGIKAEEADKIAKKLIGATWDVGHINQLRKSGYSEEDILKETEKIAPFVKHVHLTDNFGYADTHLPPGMGNVPIREILAKLEKEGDMEGVRQIVEAGNFVQAFKDSPYPYTLEAVGSPIYSIGGAPYWSEIADRSSRSYYATGFGEMLPDYHFKQFYGGGWAAVPRELGGEVRGSSDKGRFAEGQ